MRARTHAHTHTPLKKEIKVKNIFIELINLIIYI